MSHPNIESLRAELRAKSDADPLGFRKSAAWDAIFDAGDLTALRKRLSADDISRLVNVIVPAADGAHHWRLPDNVVQHECCRRCGIIRRADGRNNPCRGTIAVKLRD